MKSKQQIALFLASAISATAIDCPGADAAGTPCTNGVFVLSARGTNFAAGNTDPNRPGIDYTVQQGQEVIAGALLNKTGGYCRSLPYAAAGNSIFGFYYDQSVNYGIAQGQRIVKEYVDRCKSSVKPRIVLLGYSQGGQVMTSVLIGEVNGGPYGVHPNIDAYKQYIAGGAFFASPSFVSGYTIDGGNATQSGVAPRGQADYQYFNSNYNNRVRNHCQSGDTFCASGGFSGPSGDIHTRAVITYRQQAIDFLLPKV